MSDEYCPHCKVSLRGNPIPRDQQTVFNALGKEPGSEGWVTHFSRKIGVEVTGVYDGVLYWQCPDCHGAWNRWPTGLTAPYIKGLHARAEREMAKNEINRMHHTSCTTEECRPRTDNWDLVTCQSCMWAKPEAS